MKKTIVVCASVGLLLMSCNSSEVETSSETALSDGVEREVAEPSSIELSTEQRILGDWVYHTDFEGTPIEITLSLNEDGTYAQSMAGNPMAGTWEFVEDEFIIVKSEFIQNPNGQKWQIVKSTSDELYIDWNLGGGEAKVLEFKRK